MQRFITHNWKQIFFCFIMMIFEIAGGAWAEEEPSSPSQKQMSEILDVLSGFAGNAGKKASSKTIPRPLETMKMTDLKSVIQILQVKKDRDQVIKVLSALAYIQAENEKKASLPSHFKDSLISVIDITSEVLLNSLGIITQIPEAVVKITHVFSEQQSRADFIEVLLTVSVAFIMGAMVEVMVRLCIRKFGLHQPKTYSFYNIIRHILYNILPVILFGISAYSVVFCYPLQTGWLTEKSFMFVTTLIMIRTSFMIFRVLFISRYMQEIQKGYPSYLSSYQFVIAGVQLLITGIIFAELGKILGAGDQIYQIWLKILSFGIVTLLILAIWKIRLWGIERFEFEDEKSSPLSSMGIRLIQLLGRYWHWFISFAILLSFFLYFIGMSNHSFFIASATVLTIGLTSLTLWIRNSLRKLYRWLERKVDENDSLLSSLSTQPRVTFVNFLQFFLHTTYIIFLLQIWGVDPLGFVRHSFVQPYLARAISITLIIMIIRLSWVGTNYIAASHVQPKVVNGRTIEPSLFVKTIAPILKSICHWALAITGVILILEEVGIPVMPIIYGISVIGIAISLGAQSLVKDLINGVLTLMEGNIAVGETVVIGAYTGVVESLSLRGVSLRHGTGALQTIPFSEVTSIINKSRDHTGITIELPVPYGTEMGKVREVLQLSYNEVMSDPFFQKMAIDPVKISGIDRFTDAGFIVVARVCTKPDPKNSFLRAFNQRLKIYLEKEKITPPSSPTTLIINKSDVSITPEGKEET